MKLKLISLLCLTLLLISCYREPPPEIPPSYTVDLLYPSAQTTVSTDTFSVIIKVESTDISTFSKISIAGEIVQPVQPQIYKRLFNRSMFQSPRMKIPVSFLKDETLIHSDTVRLIYFKLKYENSFEMFSPRSNHASTVISGHQILTSGGISVAGNDAVKTYEIFDTETNQSTETISRMNYGRAGHGMIYDQSFSKVYVFGGGKKQYAPDGDGEKIPNERFEIGQPSINSVNDILDQDFAYCFDGTRLFVQGGVNKNSYSTLYAIYKLNDSLSVDLLNQKSLGLGEHILISDSTDSRFMMYLGYQFNGQNVNQNSGFIAKNTGGIYYENISLSEPRNELCAINLENKFVLVSGGFSVQNGAEKILNSFELIDLLTLKTYKISQKMNSERASHTMCKLGDTFFILGGYNQNGNVLKSIEKFTYQF